jgi:hypothetical protein
MAILTIKQLVGRYDFLTESKVRNWIARAYKNGIDCCLVRPPETQRVLVDDVIFDQWLRGKRIKEKGDE